SPRKGGAEPRVVPDAEEAAEHVGVASMPQHLFETCDPLPAVALADLDHAENVRAHGGASQAGCRPGLPPKPLSRAGELLPARRQPPRCCKSRRMGRAGLEPATPAFSVRCSTN